MKRFLVFAGNITEEEGGMYDFHDSFATEKEALDELAEITGRRKFPHIPFQWGHVYDQETGKYIKEVFYN